MNRLNPSDPPRFAELLGRSCFSFLEGASHPEELVCRAKELELQALAVCDRDGLYGLVRAHTEAKKLGQKIIAGAELTLEPLGAPPAEARDAERRSIALLVQDRRGYSNLCHLLTLAHADHEKGTAGIPLETILQCSSGLMAILPMEDPPPIPVPVPVSRFPFPAPVPVPVSRFPFPAPDSLFGPLHDTFGDRAFIATWRHLDRRDADRTAAAIAASTRYGMDIIATARPLYHHPSRKPLADVLHCIRHKTTLDRAGVSLTPNAEAFLRSPAQMLALFRDKPEWVLRTVEIAARLTFSFSELRYRFPSDARCLPGETPDQALRRLVDEGCLHRYPEGTPPAVRAQIEKELALIQKLEVAPYFLSVQEVVLMARERRILCQGRGSAANSAVCFVLGMTAVDPARSNLLFERFLSAERHEPPDIDIDFEHERREEVIQAIYDAYGRDRAAMVSEVISYRGKSALREVGKAFGLSLDQVDRLSSLVAYQDPEVSAHRVAEVGLDPTDGRLKQVILLANALEGFPRHLSIHVGGFVISAEPLHHVAPIEPARMEGRTVIPWDKDDLDDLGFFKIDVLALGILTAIRKTLAMIHEGRHSGAGPHKPPFDPIAALASIPPEVPAVYEAIQRADTVGVFQIESRAQMSMLPRLRPKKFYDLVIEVAIVRPGPIQGGMVHPYLRRRTGEEAPVSPHPCLDPILKRTLGVPLFQEQVMQIAMVGAGYTAGEADQLRRDMSAWKKHGRLERHRDKLLRGFAEKGISARFGEMLYQQVQGFGEYGFPESHAASFALLVYASAWLKVHHPAAFACALLNSQPMGFYSASSIVQDAQRHGVEVRPVCAVQSFWDCSLECPGPSDGALRLGLRQVKGIGPGAAQAIVAARQETPFSDLDDLIRRTNLKKNEMEALAEAGAFTELVPHRREALWRARAPQVDGLFEGVPIETQARVPLRPLRPIEQLLLDYGRVGLSLTDHPMCHLRSQLDRRGVRQAKILKTIRHGTNVAVAGLVLGRQRPATASGVTFITLEDETGVVNLIVREQVFNDHYLAARSARILLARGRVERQGEVVHVLVQDLERLDLPSQAHIPTKSRDFH